MTKKRPFSDAAARWCGPMVLLVFLAAVWTAAGAQDVRFFRIGTGASSGLFFPIGGLLASSISRPPGSRPCDEGGSCGVPGLIAVAQSTDGGLANIRGIAAREFESGFARGDLAWRAHRQLGPFAAGKGKKKSGSGKTPDNTKLTSLRAIGNLYPEALYVLVAANSKVRKIADLKRKTVSVGPKDSHAALSTQLILDAFGLKGRRVKAVHHGPEAAVALLAEGKLDAVFLFEPLPSPRIHKLAETFPIRLLPVAGEPIAALTAKYPWLTPTQLQGDIYHDVAGVASVKVGTLWLVSADVEEELVFQITRALWHKNTIALIAKGHEQGRSVTPVAALVGVSVPLHKGAARYYREAGMLKGLEGESSEKTPKKKAAKN